jgi:pimeloyl-ACP methyl ester carboxylesterase
MRSSEIETLGAIGGTALARFGGIARDVHGAVAGRAFGTLGALGAPVRVMHNGITALAYGAVGGALRAVPRAAGLTLAQSARRGAPPLADAPGGALALAALNGFYGDAIAREHRELAPDLSIRRRGRAVTADSEGLARAYPDATPKLAVFVHGLCETEHAWSLTPLARDPGERRSYGARLRDELGYTPVYVRYNSGLHVSDNGRRLAQVLEHVLRGWSTEVDEVVLVGHSMGGLVARSACHYGEKEGHAWTRQLRHVFCLGTPHLGAPLERVANAAGYRLSRLAETRPFGDLINARSAGIKDMRFGSCVEEDWCDCDPDEYLSDRCTEVPFLPSATYYFIGATLARRSDGRLGRVVGDLLVQFPSASGNGPKRRIPFEIDNGRHVGGIHHLQLLNHPAVYEQLRGWLVREPAEVARPALGGA